MLSKPNCYTCGGANKGKHRIEHPYGTITRQWGFNHIMTKKGIKRASADVDLIMTAYNLRRLINIIGVETLMKWAIPHLFVNRNFVPSNFRN